MNRKCIVMCVIVLAGLAFLVAGCGMNQQAVTDEETLVEVSVSSIVAKTIEPNVVMDITRYDLEYVNTGTGVVRTKTNIPASSGATTVYLLLSAGTYNFTIRGFNNTDPFAIGAGAATGVRVAPKAPTPVSILVGPVTGPGSVNVTVDWTAWASRTNYNLNVSFVADVFAWNANLATDSPLFTLTPTLRATSASLTAAGVNNGYYKCRIRMRDEDRGGMIIWSVVDALRVVSSYESVETYTLDRQLDGTIVMTVMKDLQNPLAVDFNVLLNGVFTYYADRPTGTPLPDFFLVPYGQNILVEAWPRANGAGTSVDSFEWYIDGVGPFTANAGENLTSSYSVFFTGAGLNPGPFTLSVLVTKGTTVSSRSLLFIVMEP